MSARLVKIGEVSIGSGSGLALIGGPCVIENEAHAVMLAKEIKSICQEAEVQFVFKASYDKANRSSINSFRGPGIEQGLEILGRIRTELKLPVLTDVHSPAEAELAGQIVNVIQIPAFLCRQTDLLVAAGKTRRPVNIKKGQFLAPEDMALAAEKVASTGNEQILLTERGTSFGYHNLVVDMRSLAIMREIGYPVVFDGTHSVQLPGGAGTHSGGQRQFVAPLCRAAVAVGVDAIFLEVHDNPDAAPSDGANMLPLDELKKLLSQLQRLRLSLSEMELAASTR